MNNFTKYLSTAPVVATIWMTFTAGLIIEIQINRFYPDALFLPIY
nr:photosystem I subunit IX [Pseudoerythrocladia kornmannii]UNJ16671.1 photosystem I subunit IX [Pseudoerythrocladia kornmannii]